MGFYSAFRIGRKLANAVKQTSFFSVIVAVLPALSLLAQ
jgi:hypothetical protein